MADVTVAADLQVEEAGGTKRQLRTADLATDATGAAKEASLQALLTELGQKLEPADLAALATAARQDAAKAVLDAILTQLDDATTDTVLSVLKTLAGKDFATQVTLAAVLAAVDGLEANTTGLATEAKLEAVRALLAGTLTADVTDRAARLLGHVDVDTLPLPPGAAADATVAAVRDASPGTLTGRMLAKRPAAAYRLWMDTSASTNLGAGVIIAEAPGGTLEGTAVFRGILLLDAGGELRERTDFAWSLRGAGW